MASPYQELERGEEVAQLRLEIAHLRLPCVVLNFPIAWSRPGTQSLDHEVSRLVHINVFAVSKCQSG